MTDAAAIERVARDFSARLVTEIGIENTREAARVNAAQHPACDVCATHDYCDANILMSAAMEKELGLELDTLELDDDGTIALWDAAWNMAADNGFWAA